MKASDPSASDEALGRSEANFRVIIERSPDALAVYQSGLVRYANRQALR